MKSSLSDAQIAAGKKLPFLKRMFIGSDIEKAAANNPAVLADPNIRHMDTSAPGQSVPDFTIQDGTNVVNIDVTGGSATAIADHLRRDYIDGRGQILDYPTVSGSYVDDIFG